jgi:hypothetical protein
MFIVSCSGFRMFLLPKDLMRALLVIVGRIALGEDFILHIYKSSITSCFVGHGHPNGDFVARGDPPSYPIDEHEHDDDEGDIGSRCTNSFDLHSAVRLPRESGQFICLRSV